MTEQTPEEQKKDEKYLENTKAIPKNERMAYFTRIWVEFITRPNLFLMYILVGLFLGLFIGFVLGMIVGKWVI